MPVQEPFEPIYLESEETVRNRLMAELPDHLAKEEGSFARDIMEVAVIEFARLWEEANRQLSYMFPSWAWGPLLEGWATSYGLERRTGQKATGMARFMGGARTALSGQVTFPAATFEVTSTAALPTNGVLDIIAPNQRTSVSYSGKSPTTVLGVTGGEGTFPPGATVMLQAMVPPNTGLSVPVSDDSVETPRFQTKNAVVAVMNENGYVDVPIEAIEVGVDGNQAPGAVSLIDAYLPNMETITNVTPTTGGEDPEDDEQLRERVLAEAALPVGSGTKQDYRVWGTEIAGVSEVSVEPLWDRSGTDPALNNQRNGTVRMAIRGQDHKPVDWSVVQAVQRHVDPSRQLIALLENGEPWTIDGVAVAAAAWDATNQTGASSLKLAFSGSGTKVARLPQTMDLSRFAPVDGDDDIAIWVRASAWANLAATSYLRFETDSANYFQAPFSAYTVARGTAQPTSGGNTWWLLKIRKANFTKTGTPDWGLVTAVALGATATGATDVLFDYFAIRETTGAAGEGKAPIGAAVTVVTPVARAVAVTATLVLRPGFTLAGTAGTTNMTELLRGRLTAFLQDVLPGEPVRVVDVANVIHDTPGVLDFTLIAPSANQPITMHEHPVLGTLTLS
jgi:uncharacterized phage protein gp47/JayE